MKKILLRVLMVSPFIFSHQDLKAQGAVVKTESNGVVIYQATGVEGIVTTTTETPVQERGFDHWTIEQCEEVIAYIKVKSQEGCSTKEAEVYAEQLRQLEERIKTLKSNK
jgi:site-specific recombinase